MRDLHDVSGALAVAALLTISASACGSSASTPQPASRTRSSPAAPVTGVDTGNAARGKKVGDFDPSNFGRSTKIDNEWWPLRAGTRFVYEGFTVENRERVPHRLVITVTDLTKVINGVRSVVVYEKDYDEDQLVESELAFFAQDDDGNVWHLGQYRETYDQKEFVGGRTFLVGHLDGARAGIMMPAEPRLGTAAYSQGYGPPPFNWTDRGRVYQMGRQTQVPAGRFDSLLVVEENNDEEPDAFQLKYHARGVGVVRVGWRGNDPNKEELELQKVEQLNPPALAQVRSEALGLETRAYVYGSTPPADPTPTSAQHALRGGEDRGGDENGHPGQAVPTSSGAEE
jgi:hypothetical protein